MAQRFRQRTVRFSSRKGTNWARGSHGSDTIAAGPTKALLLTLVLSNPGITETIVRTRGRIFVQSDQSAAVEDQVGAFGMMVVNDLALAAGAASIPGPFTDRNDDGWFVWFPIMQRGVISTTGGNNFVGYDYDSKAKRRTEEGFGIAVMAENASTTHGLAITGLFSLLSVVNT